MSFACLEHAAELWATPSLKARCSPAVCGSAARLSSALALQDAPSLAGVQLAGLALVLFGDGIRKVAIVTAAHNFTHRVQLTHQPGHRLVRHGVYTYIRHPAYFGWYLWAVGTQVLLLNPVSTVVFAAVVRPCAHRVAQSGTITRAFDASAARCQAWLYFKRRIPFEEARLLEFFGLAYSQYRDATPTWIPGIA
jgi:protein-S-isoprenylcysteine O-methyltransferase